MEITWLGHSSVCINSRDVLLITDPYDNSDGEFMPTRSAEIVISSRTGDKHSNVAAVTGNPRIVNGPGEYEISHFYISGTGTSGHVEDQVGGPVNTIYTIRAEGLVISHLGAVTKKIPPAQMDTLRQTQILTIPISGEDILTGSEAQEIISAIQPRILIPIQYGDGGPNKLEAPDKFLSELGITELPISTPRINITETNLPTEMQVSLLRRAT